MKAHILFIVFFFFSFTVSAQKNLEKAVKETCDCFDKNNPGENITQEEFTALISKCLEQPLASYYGKICKETGIKADNSSESFEQVGAKIGGKLVSDCPLFLKMSSAVNKSEQSSSTKTTEETGKEGSFVGKIISIDKKEFYNLTLEGSTGKKETFLWMRSFKGAAPFENNPIGQVGKKIILKYRELLCIDPATNDYVTKKEIIEITME